MTPKFKEDDCGEVLGICGYWTRAQQHAENAISMLIEQHAKSALVALENAVPKCSIVKLHN